MTIEENNESRVREYDISTLVLLILLSVLFVISLIPKCGLVINNNNLFLLAIIVVLVLSNRFSEIQIPGFLKLSRTVKAMQKEAESLRELMIHQFSYTNSQASASSNVSLTVQRDQVKELGIDEIPDEIKSEVDEIKESDRDPGVVFIELVSGIERKLALLGERFLGGSTRHRPVSSIVRELEKKQIIDGVTSSLILDFWNIRNQIVHGERAINRDIINEATQIGGKIMAKLMLIYGPIIQISAIMGLIGDKIKVAGAAFSSNNNASIYFDFVNEAGFLTKVKTDDKGSFNTEITIPNTSVSQHYLWIKDELTGYPITMPFQVVLEGRARAITSKTQT